MMRVVLAILMLKLCLGCLGGANIKRTNRLASPAEDTTLTPCENDKVRVRGKCVDPLDKFKEECLAQQKLWVPESKEKPCLSELESDEWACKSLGGTWSSEAKCLDHEAQNVPNQRNEDETAPVDENEQQTSIDAETKKVIETVSGEKVSFSDTDLALYKILRECRKREDSYWDDTSRTCVHKKKCKLFWDQLDRQCRTQEQCERNGKYTITKISDHAAPNLCATKKEYEAYCQSGFDGVDSYLVEVDEKERPIGCIDSYACVCAKPPCHLSSKNSIDYAGRVCVHLK